MRVIVITTLSFAVGLILLNRGYLAPYDSALGQLVLGLVGLLFGGAFWWLSRMARVPAPERLLAAEPGEEATA